MIPTGMLLQGRLGLPRWHAARPSVAHIAAHYQHICTPAMPADVPCKLLAERTQVQSSLVNFLKKCVV